jgi:hypothetical protein
MKLPNGEYEQMLGGNPNSRVAVRAVLPNGDTALEFESISAAARAGFNRQMIRKCLLDETKTHKGYFWITAT